MHFVPNWGNPLGRIKRRCVTNVTEDGFSFSSLSPLVLVGGDVSSPLLL